jgi:pSer/pThr/pTyr-binding forkhead associated (FHA) protein
MKLIIEDDEGRKTVVPLVREEITIGRQDGNTIRLTERNVSRRHARLVKENGNILIEDLGSYNGVRVNGEKITGPTKIKEGDLVEIGDYDLGIQGKLDTPMTSEAVSKPPPPPKQSTIPPGAVKAPAKTTPPQQAAAAPPAPAPQAAPPAPAPQAQSASPTAGGATAIIRVSDIMKAAPQVEVRDLDRAEMPRLVGLSGPYRAKEFYLMRSEVTFGRTDDNDIVADHQSVSRNHCKFVLDQGQWKVMDNKSANGVRVNGEEYAISNIKPGDTLELGHLKFRFCGPGEKFTPPAEKVEGEPQKGGMKPTTAELIAGASQPGRMATTGPSKAVKAGPPIGLIAGIGGGVIVALGIVIVLLLRGGKGGENEPKDTSKLSAAEAVKEGDAAFKRHEYEKASELYEQAIAEGTTPSNRKRALEEAKGERVYKDLKEAMSGDPDKAKSLFDKCASESTYWCQQAQTQVADQVKASYAQKHLGAANAAKSAGKSDACTNEVNLVLAFDPNNSEAQGIQCSPEAAAKPPPEKHEGPSPAERNAKATKLAKEAYEKVMVAHDFKAGVTKGLEGLKLNPTDPGALRVLYQATGYGYAQLGDRANASKYLTKYLPYAPEAEQAQIKRYLGIQ